LFARLIPKPEFVAANPSRRVAQVTGCLAGDALEQMIAELNFQDWVFAHDRLFGEQLFG
jgi:hypothetical protein